jgi:hypothetical protein
MFESAVKGLAAILDRNHWVAELAGILPLSALIDFIDIPPKLHIFQLAGAAPLWSWPVTPAGSRLLLSDDKSLQQGCYLDRYGNSVALLGLDGRWGERYNLASPETVRLCVTSHRACTIDNLHGNMNDDDKRIQNLEVIYVSRLQPPNRHELSSSWLRHVFLDPWWMYSPRYLATSILGWITLLGMIAMCIILQTYLAMAFLLVVPLTGTVIFALYGSSPRGLLVTEPVSGKRYNRLILVAEHVNAADWIVFYGESTIVNSLLNRPLEPRGPRKSWSTSRILRLILRILILGQWAAALGAAATKDWNSYFICFWIAFCIIVHSYVIPAESEAKEWMHSCAKIQFDRYQTQLSSRRALLNTIVALNPDTFQPDDQTNLFEAAIKWVNPILEQGDDRSKWEHATQEAMNEAPREFSHEYLASDLCRGIKGNFLSSEWNKSYENNYWRRFIPEGIYMAAKIRLEANLPERMAPATGEPENGQLEQDPGLSFAGLGSLPENSSCVSSSNSPPASTPSTGSNLSPT